MRSIFFSPHADDECLFGAFTLLKYQPTVVICFPSSGDYGSTGERFRESQSACFVLGVSDVRQWPGDALQGRMLEIDEELQPEIVWAPTAYASHPDHRAVSKAADIVFGSRLRRYDTYAVSSDGQSIYKDMRLPAVLIENSRWIADKHFALTRYQTQITHPRAAQFFTWGLTEFAEQP